MRKIAALAVASVSLVALVGCKSSSDGGSTATTTAETTAETTATTGDGTTETTEWVSDDTRNQGVTDTSIKVGISYQVFTDDVKQKLKTWHGDYKAMYEAYIDHINANGGINGRTIDAVYSPYELGVDGAADAVCTQLAVEEKVFAVVGYTAGDEANCYINVNEIPYVGGTQTEELRAGAKVAWFSPDPSTDAEADAVKQLAEEGLLDGTLAVIGTSDDQANYDGKFEAVLSDAGITPADTAFIDFTSNDENIILPAIDAAIERFRGKGVDTLLMVGSGAGSSLLKEMAKLDFKPAVRLSVVGGAGMYAGDESADRSVLDGAIGMGLGDNGNTYLTDTDEPTASCLAIFKDAGIELADKATWTFESGIGKTWVGAGVVCKYMELFEAILTKAGANLDFGSFKHAGETLGEIYLYGSTKPYNFGPGNSTDGDPGQVLFDFVLEKNSFMPRS